MLKIVHDSRELVQSQPADWHHKIGVLAHNPIAHHAGLNSPAINIQADYPVLWSNSVGGYVDASKQNEQIAENLRFVIEKIDAAISELIEHRARLSKAVERQSEN